MEQIVRQQVRRLVRAIFPLISTLDWTDAAFDLRKASVCSRLAALAYIPISSEELKTPRSTVFIPSLSYQELFQLALAAGVGTTQFVSAALADERDFIDDFFIYEGRSVLAVAIHLKAGRLFHRPNHYPHDGLFVAVRGTQYLYDWGIDVSAAQTKHRCGQQTVRFHRGFYKEAAEEGANLIRAIAAWRSNTFDWHGGALTGHSLGGAIASIWHDLETHFLDHRLALQPPNSYAFGSPRYADRQLDGSGRGATIQFANESDLVPRLPPRVPIPFVFPRYVDPAPRVVLPNILHEDRAVVSWRLLRRIHTALSAHSMERYIEIVDHQLSKS